MEEVYNDEQFNVLQHQADHQGVPQDSDGQDAQAQQQMLFTDQTQLNEASEPSYLQGDNSPTGQGRKGLENVAQAKSEQQAVSQASTNATHPGQILAISGMANQDPSMQNSPEGSTKNNKTAAFGGGNNIPYQNSGGQLPHSHLKSQSSHNTNYQSNLNPIVMQENTANSSLGRNTANNQFSNQNSQHKEGNDLQIGGSKLHSGAQAKSAGTTAAQMKRNPSRQKISDKTASANRRAGKGATNLNNNPQDPRILEVSEMYHPQKSSVANSNNKSHSRGTSQTNRVQQQQLNQQQPNQMASHMQHNAPFTQNFTGSYDSSSANTNAQPQQNMQMPDGQMQNFNFIQMNQAPFQFTSPIPGQGQPMMSNGQMQGQMQSQMSAPINGQMQGYQMQPQPQIHFVAKQQKFYGISPDRAPLIFNSQGNVVQDKRPYTSSGNVLTKRTQNSKNAQHNSAIAALYLGNKTHQTGFNLNGQHRNASQPNQEIQNLAYQTSSAIGSSAYSMHQIPSKRATANSNNRLVGQTSSANAQRKANFHIQKENEQLYEEAIRMKQQTNMHKDENVKLKTKIKILENEMGRKERALEDFYTQNQFIVQASKNSNTNGQLAPIAQTAARYQQETFLVMSLKKQVKELKTELVKKDEELLMSKRNIKQTRFFELDQEIKIYKEELSRMRYMLEHNFMAMNQKRLSHHASVQNTVNEKSPLPNGKMATSASYSEAGHARSDNNAPATGIYAGHQSQDAIKKNDDHMTSGSVYGGVQMNNMVSLGDPASINALEQTVSSQATPIMFTSLGNGMPNDTRHVMQSNDDLVNHLKSQMTEKDLLIQQLQNRIDELSTKSILEAGSSVIDRTPARDDEKKPSTTSKDLTKAKKSIRDKEKEILKLKQENTQLAAKANNDEEAQKIKQLHSQINQEKKKNGEFRTESKKKDERIESLTKDFQAQQDIVKAAAEKSKKEAKKLQQKIDDLNKQLEEASKNSKLQSKPSEYADEPSTGISKDNTRAQTQTAEEITKENNDASKKERGEKLEKELEEMEKLQVLRESCYDELNIICAIVGRKEDIDRVDLSVLLKTYKEVSYLEFSDSMKDFINACALDQLAPMLPRYALGSDERDRFLHHKLRLLIKNPDLLSILEEKEHDENLPFDALKELCDKFNKPFSDEQCAFICSSFLKKIDNGSVFIDFASFLGSLKADQEKSSKHFIEKQETLDSHATDDEKRTLDPVKEESETNSQSGATPKEKNKVDKKLIDKKLAGKDPEKRNRLANKLSSGSQGESKSFDEEQMLDIAESCFIKMAELLLEKGKSVRSLFLKYSVPEMFPDRTVLELLSPLSLLEGIKEIGLDDLQEIEAACLMRVLAKPELENAIILNELVLIMENFGVPDNPDEEDEEDDYIPDTETEDNQDAESAKAAKTEADSKEAPEPKEESKKAEEPEQIDTTKKETAEKPAEETSAKDKADKSKSKSKKRVHKLENIDEKGIKILRKLARFLLKQFLHPREFFGKAIYKERIKTKKREFFLDVIKVKDFYLRIKIASIRKRLTENESLNNELCLDKNTHPTLFNVKNMVKALEEIAEEEQVIMMKQEKEARAAKAKESKANAEGDSEPDTPKSGKGDTTPKEKAKKDTADKKDSEEKSLDTKAKKEGPEDYFTPGSTSEVMRFGNARVGSSDSSPGRSPGTASGPTHYVHLNTIEEEKHETQTSNYFDGTSEREDSRLMGSNNLRGSNIMKEFDLEDEQKKSVQKLGPEFFNKSLTKEDMQKMPGVNQNDPKSADRNISVNSKDKKLSQSVADAKIKQMRDSGASSEVFDFGSDASLSGESPPQKTIAQAKLLIKSERHQKEKAAENAI